MPVSQKYPRINPIFLKGFLRRIGVPILLYLALQIINFSCRKSDYYLDYTEIIRDNGGGTGSVRWTNDKEYLIDGLVFVNDGQVLTIEAGTVIKGRQSIQGRPPAALVIARGGKIIAEGTPSAPIIFTSELDHPVGSLSLSEKGLWGGIIILGNAPVNVPGGEDFIEGIPLSEPRGIYGGSYEDDNSGIFCFVSIRHAGIETGEENEINGLTLGGVGRKTRIDHVEVISSGDDGFEFFGGNVSCKNLIAAFCNDDAFDFDQGYSGKLQFLLGIKDELAGDCISEHSDFFYLSGRYPDQYPIIYNATFIGNQSESQPALIRFYHRGAGIYRNSLFLNSVKGIEIEYNELMSSYEQIQRNKLSIEKNIFHGIMNPELQGMITIIPQSEASENLNNILGQYFISSGNTTESPGVRYLTLPLEVLPGFTVYENMADYSHPWFEHVTYKGAFGSRNWAEAWSLLWIKKIIN